MFRLNIRYNIIIICCNVVLSVSSCSMENCTWLWVHPGIPLIRHLSSWMTFSRIKRRLICQTIEQWDSVSMVKRSSMTSLPPKEVSNLATTSSLGDIKRAWNCRGKYWTGARIYFTGGACGVWGQTLMGCSTWLTLPEELPEVWVWVLDVWLQASNAKNPHASTEPVETCGTITSVTVRKPHITAGSARRVSLQLLSLWS